MFGKNRTNNYNRHFTRRPIYISASGRYWVSYLRQTILSALGVEAEESVKHLAWKTVNLPTYVSMMDCRSLTKMRRGHKGPVLKGLGAYTNQSKRGEIF
jgi:hypothetical protein